MSLPRLILVGGFLGAGKTTLLGQAALRFKAQGKRVGLVANDQAAQLVDTEVLKATGARVEEVAGGCFCCRFPDLIAALERLAEKDQADVLLGEPVGSCTDLSATVMQPLKDIHGSQFNIAPLSVLVDSTQVTEQLQLPSAKHRTVAERFPDNVRYIYEKQLEEADLIVLNKVDFLSGTELDVLKISLAERFPGKPLVSMSAQNGEGIDAWMDYVCTARIAGRHIVAVDYDTYAAGEAALGWLNASVALRTMDAATWPSSRWEKFGGTLLETIRRQLASHPAEIAHLKLSLRHGIATLNGNLTSNHGPISVRGQLAAPSREAELRINARVHVAHEVLQAIVEGTLDQCSTDGMQATVTSLRSLSPGRPEPTHRYAAAIV